MRRIWLYTAQAWHHPTGQAHTLRWAGPGGYLSWPSDDPPSTLWAPVVQRPVDLVLQIPAPGDDARSRAAEARVTLSNVMDRQTGRGARALNVLVADYQTAGWPIAIDELTADQPLAAAIPRFRGRMGRAGVQRGAIVIPIQDRTADFDAAVATDAYGGTGGLDGPAALAGKTKERTWGEVAALAPTYLGVIDGLHVLSVNAGRSVDAIEAFGDGGAERPYVAGTPTGEQWTCDLSTGLIRCAGATAPQQPWARVRGDKPNGVYRNTVGALASWLVGGETGKRAASEIDWEAVAALDATPRIVGLHAPAGAMPTIRELLDLLAGSVWGGYWTEGMLGRFRVGRVPALTGAPKATWTANKGCDPLVPGDEGPAAAKQLTWRYARNYARTDQPAGSASTEQAARIKAEYLDVVVKRPDVFVAWGAAARDAEQNSLLARKVHAEAEAALAADDLATPHRLFDVTVWDGAPSIDIGDEVRIVDDIPGFEAGGGMVIVGRNITRRGGRATLIGMR